MTQEPPHNLLAEQWVLGAAMRSASALADIVEILRAEDFYRPAHQLIYTAIVEVHRKGKPVDMVTVFDALLNAGEHDRTGGVPYLHTLVSSVDTPAAALHYAKIVRDQAVMRRLTETGARMAAFGQSGAADLVAEFVSNAQEELKTLLDRTATEDWARLGDAAPETLDDIEASATRGKDGITGLATGFIDFDRLTSGLQSGQFIIVAGRPAMGKTTWATDVLRNAAIRLGEPAVIFSLEMDRRDLIKRILSAQARVPFAGIRSGMLSDEEWTRIARALGGLADAPLFIDDTPNVTLESIRAKCRRLKETAGLSLVVVDYLQLMVSAEKTESRQQEVSRISRGLKLLARELEVPLIGVCQLNRGPEQRTDKRPMVSDLRESGSLEQDADMVILLHREDAYDRESPRAGEADVIVGKHRNGPTATITVAFQGHYCRFVDMAPS